MNPPETPTSLEERLRRGELARERVLLAAYVGDETARAALGVLAPGELDLPRFAPAGGDLERWVFGLKRWGKPAEVRAGVAIGRMALAAWSARYPRDPRLEAAVLAAEAWVACPCAAHAEAAHAAAHVVALIPDQEHAEDERDVRPRRARSCFEGVAGAVRSTSPTSAWTCSSAAYAAELTSDEAVRAAVREALVRWALDPRE